MCVTLGSDLVACSLREFRAPTQQVRQPCGTDSPHPLPMCQRRSFAAPTPCSLNDAALLIGALVFAKNQQFRNSAGGGLLTCMVPSIVPRLLRAAVPQAMLQAKMGGMAAWNLGLLVLCAHLLVRSEGFAIPSLR